MNEFFPWSYLQFRDEKVKVSQNLEWIWKLSSSMDSSFQNHHYCFNKLTELWCFSDRPSEWSLSKPWEWSYNLYVCKYTSRNWDSSNAFLGWCPPSLKRPKPKSRTSTETPLEFLIWYRYPQHEISFLDFQTD